MTLLHVAWKDLRLLVRDRGALAFTLLVPLAVVTIVAETLSGGGAEAIRLPVVNEDEGPVAEVLIEALSEHVEVVEMPREQARGWVSREKNAAAALVLPERTSKRYLADRASTLTLWTDPAKGSELGIIRAYLLLAQREAAALADPFYEELLVVEEENLTGSRLSTSSVEQNVPGFSIMFVLMGVLFGLAYALRAEHDDGTWVRMRAAPVSRRVVLGGKLLARYVAALVQMLILFVYGHLRYGLVLGAGPFDFLVTAIVVTFALSGFSLVVAALPRSREQIIPLGLTVVMLVCSIGGCWWPLFMEPLWLQQVAHAAPTAWAMDAMNDLLLRERGVTEMGFVLGVMVAYGAACVALGMWLHRESG